MWILFIFVIRTASYSFMITDQCTDICKNAQLPALELDYYEQVVCQRGCRFFNIIKYKDEHKINTTKKECHVSCEESYIEPKENQICQTGCNMMAKEQEAIISGFIIEEESSIVLASPDRDIEFDLLSDPSIKSQLEIGFNIDYKIPETRIRTMPIEIKELTKDSGDWLDCASRNSGIPRWILLTAILSAVLVALWLSFSTDKRGSQDENVTDIDIPDDKLILESETVFLEKDPNMLETPPLYFEVKENEDFVVSPPPYEEGVLNISEKV